MPGPIRSILLRLDVRAAGRLSHCKHDGKHAIAKGEVRFVVRERGPGAPERGYCASCALKMIENAEAALAELKATLR